MKYPVLYKRGTTDFNNNGKGVLADAFNVKVKEVINDLFTLDFNYPITSKLGYEIMNGDIIRIDASNVLRNQKFRIMSITQNDDLTISVHCLHKSYDTSTDYVRGPLNLVNASCEYALNMLFNKSMKSKNYVGVSDIQNAQNFTCEGKQLGDAIVGSVGSIIDTYGLGAQIERDNSEVDKIKVLKRRGKDTNILVSYGKNITGYKCVMDEQSLATVLIPFAIDNTTQGKIIGDALYAPNYKDFDGELYIVEVDMTERFSEGETVNTSTLARKAEEYMQESKCNIPKFTYTIDFEKLDTSTLPDDYNLEKLYEVNIGDTLIVRHKYFNVDTQAKVSSIEYDPIAQKYSKLVFGDIRASFGEDFNTGVIVGPPGQDGKPGIDGKPGLPGADGKTYYTWIRYADNEQGHGMSDLPKGKKYIGLAYNKETPLESENPNEYTWSKFVGDQGIPGQPGINGTDGKTYYTWVKYADSPTSGMSDDPTGKEYLGLAYNKETQKESSNYSDYTWSKIKGSDGIPGKPGADGKTYYTWIKYADDANGNGISDDSTNKKYIGMAFNKEVQQESSNPQDYTWSKLEGDDGLPGKPGADGKTYYTWVKYADSPTTGMSDSPLNKTYIGLAFNKEVQKESTNYGDYTWSKIKGDDGIPGIDGKTYYTWLKYADDAQGNGMSDTPDNKEYLGLAFNKEVQQESTNPRDYTWSKIKGDQGIPGIPGQDGKTYYTWVKYADTPTSGMSDDPLGKTYLGLAYNKETPQESTDYNDYTWCKIKGDDGSIGDFPDTLPAIPKLTAEVVGLSGIDLSWTFENKMYYSYELYASQVKDFSPNVFDKIFEGKASSFLHQVQPNENWYFRVRAVNSYGHVTGFSDQVTVTTNKQDSFEKYFSSLAVSQLVADIFSVNHMHAGIIKGNWIDAKNLTVTDGNGKRTLDIDSFGRITILPTNFKMLIDGQEESVVTVSEFNANNESINMKFEQTGGTNEIRNSKCINSTDFWTTGGHSGTPVVKLNTGQNSIQFEVHNYGSAGGIQTDCFPVKAESVHTLSFEYNILRGMESYCELHFYSYENIGFNVAPDIQKVVLYDRELGASGEIKYTFRVPQRTQFMKVYFHTAYNGTESDKYDYAYFTIYNLRCFESELSGKWQPAPNESYTGNIKINEKGIEQVYNNKFKSRWGADALEFLTPNNVRKLAIDRSQICTYNFDDGNFLSFIGATKHNGATTIYGNSISTSRHCAFYDVSHNPDIIDDSKPLDFLNSYFRINFYNFDNQKAGTHIYKYPLFVHQNVEVDNNLKVTQDLQVWGDIRAEKNINAKYINCTSGIEMNYMSINNLYATKYGPGTSAIVKGNGKMLELGGLSAGDYGGTRIGCATDKGDVQMALWISSPSFVWNYADWNFGGHNIYDVRVHASVALDSAEGQVLREIPGVETSGNILHVDPIDACVELVKENKQVNNELNTSLLANADMYEMLIAITPSTYSLPINESIVNVYVTLIEKQLKTINDVPEHLKASVESKLTK